jgi:hypothetical protein
MLKYIQEISRMSTSRFKLKPRATFLGLRSFSEGDGLRSFSVVDLARLPLRLSASARTLVGLIDQ